MPFNIAADLKLLGAPHREEFLQHGKTLKSNSSPHRGPSPTNKWQARLASRRWHPDGNEGNCGTFVRRDALRLVRIVNAQARRRGTFTRRIDLTPSFITAAAGIQIHVLGKPRKIGGPAYAGK